MDSWWKSKELRLHLVLVVIVRPHALVITMAGFAAGLLLLRVPCQQNGLRDLFDSEGQVKQGLAVHSIHPSVGCYWTVGIEVRSPRRNYYGAKIVEDRDWQVNAVSSGHTKDEDDAKYSPS